MLGNYMAIIAVFKKIHFSYMRTLELKFGV